MVPACDLLGLREKGDGGVDVAFGQHDGIAAKQRMCFHHRPFFRRQLAWLEQDGIGNANLADVMQGRRAGEHVDVVAVERCGKSRVAGEPRRQQMHVALRALDVVAGLVVARLGKMRQRADADRLNQLVFAHAAGDLGFK